MALEIFLLKPVAKEDAKRLDLFIRANVARISLIPVQYKVRAFVTARGTPPTLNFLPF